MPDTQEQSRTTELTPDDHAFFVEHGYLIVKNVVPPDVIAEAVAFLDAGGFEGEVGAPDYRPRLGEVVAACVTDRVHGVLQELVGREYTIPRKTGAVDMPRVYAPDTPWSSQHFHVDSDYATRMPTEDVLSHFIFLTPVRSRGGAFQYGLGSAQRYFAVMGDNPESLSLMTARPELSGTVQEFLAEPGDMLVMTHLGGHAGSSNAADPQTRHALLDRYDTDRRLVPGLKPLDEMSSAEKVYSARFLRERQNRDIPLPPLTVNAETDAVLRGGAAIAPDLVSYETFLERARPGLRFVARSAPGTIQQAVTEDFVRWSAAPALTLPGAEITHLHEYKRDGGLTLLVGGRFPETEGRLLCGPVPDALSAETLPGAAFAFAHYTTGYGSRTARGRVVFTCPADRPHTLLCRWGKTWAEALASEQSAEAASLPAPARFRDAFVAPTNAGPPFALLADVDSGGDGPSGLHFSVSRDVARYDTPLAPLLSAGGAHSLRVFARARSYWLVTYLLGIGGETRLFWGVIDWEKTPVSLTQIETAAALQEACCIVGWI